MAIPEMPWYKDMEKALRPLDPYTRIILLAMAGITVWVAWKGDAMARTAWIVYLVSP
jgi:hypothetical protein